MIESIVSKIQDFRNRLFGLFKLRAGATMDLIDALAGPSCNSVVKTSLSPLFRRKYSSITDVADNMFRRTAEENPTEKALQEEHLKITQVLAAQCPPPGERRFTLIAVDCTAKPRIFSEKVADRCIVHAPSHVPGQKPITVGHEYSLVVYLPENKDDRNAHWTCPLSIRRVQSHETGPQVGFEQIRTVITQTALQHELCVSVSDSAYSTKEGILSVAPIPNWINISRLRNNRILYRQPPPQKDLKRRRGRPPSYGEIFRLGVPPKPDEEMQFAKITATGKRWVVHLSRWKNLLMKGDKNQHTEKYPFDVIRVQICNAETGKFVFKKPLWAEVTGQRRDELMLKEIYDCYVQRYDIEHCFRFGKQQLLLASAQTPDTRHEENLAWLAMLSFSMLYQVRRLATEVTYPWERRKVTAETKTTSPSRVQRDYERIIREIGTPAPIPKRRGKSPGRQKGAIVPHRKEQIVIRKARPMAARC